MRRMFHLISMCTDLPFKYQRFHMGTYSSASDTASEHYIRDQNQQCYEIGIPEVLVCFHFCSSPHK